MRGVPNKELLELESKFILDKDAELEDIGNLIERILKFCKIDKNGFVVIKNKELSSEDQIMLILSARFLGYSLKKKLEKELIKKEVEIKEFYSIMKNKGKKDIRNRLSDLKKGGKIDSPKRGIYVVIPYFIEETTKRLEGEKDG